MTVLAVAATHNAHKLCEIKRILRGCGLQVRSLDRFPPMPEVIENGKTLAANALKKARAVSLALGLPALADDSGLFVPALRGRPGVRSARYAGPECDYAKNNAKLLRALQHRNGKERRAYFATAIAFIRPGQKPVVRLGKIWGTLAPAARGKQGFGYDPLFIPKGETRTFAEMPGKTKNRISHRAMALKKMADYLKRNRLEKKLINL